MTSPRTPPLSAGRDDRLEAPDDGVGLPPQSHTIDGLLRFIEAHDSALALITLMADEHKLQLLRRMRASSAAPASHRRHRPA